MCLTRYEDIVLENLSDISCRFIRQLENKQCLVPRFIKSSTLRNTFGILIDEFNRTISYISPMLLYHEHLYKLIGYKSDNNTNIYETKSHGFITYECKLTSDNRFSTYSDITVYLYDNDKFVKIGTPICVEHLFQHVLEGTIEKNDSLDVYMCAFTSWTDVKIDHKELLSIIPKDCHNLWLKNYDRILWNNYLNEEHEMPFRIIPKVLTSPPRLRFQYYEKINKNVYYDLFIYTLNLLFEYIKNIIIDFNETDVLEYLYPQDISDTVISVNKINLLIANGLYLMQGTDVALDTLYYDGLIINDTEKNKLIKIIENDFNYIKEKLLLWKNS